MVVNGWTLLFHEAIIVQVKNLADAYERTRKGNPKGFRSDANVKLLAALAKLVLEIIPANPAGLNTARATLSADHTGTGYE